MSAIQFRAILSDLNLTQVKVANVFGISFRTVIRWSSGDSSIPPTAAIILRLMQAKKLSIEDVAAVEG